MIEKLGKIQEVHLGYGGYQDAMFGFTFYIGSSQGGWKVTDFWGAWGIERSEHSNWSEEGRVTALGNACMRVLKLCKDAKREELASLVNTPVEATFDDTGKLSSWRILTEVI